MIMRPCVFGPGHSIEAAGALRVNFTSFENFPETTSSVALGVNPALDSLNLEFLFDYEVFPPQVLTTTREWLTQGRKKMRPGDLIVQRAFLPPVGTGIFWSSPCGCGSVR
jgi:hypothetical protein